MDYLHSKESLAEKIFNSTSWPKSKERASLAKLLWMAYLWGHRDALTATKFMTESESVKDLDNIWKISEEANVELIRLRKTKG